MSELLISTNRAVRTLTFNRPGRLNAFTASLHAALRKELADAMHDEAVRVIVLTGAGRAFSSGHDLAGELPRDTSGVIDLERPVRDDYNPLIRSIVNSPKPVIAALNGPAVGAAMNIALACDIVLAARSAILQQAFVKIGLIPDAGGTWLLPRLLGPKQALALMMTADPLNAVEAERLGLVYRVFDDQAFADEVAAFAEKLANGPLLAYELMREALHASQSNTLDEQLELEAALQKRAGASPDFAEGVSAFLAKRAPQFGQ